MITICPYCNYKATNHETLDKQKNPKDTDISFCIKCGEMSEYNNNKLVKVKLEDLEEDIRKEVNDIRIAWIKTMEIKNKK